MKKLFLFACLLMAGEGYAQQHPCFLTDAQGKTETQRLVREEEWAKEVFGQLKRRTDQYADKGAEWLTSRLQMYWKSRATEVYIKGEYYSHAGGPAAPAPTVMYTGARSHATNYERPKLEDLPPYQEDERGLYLVNKVLEGKPHEWAPLSKTGNIIQSINNEIVSIARDAAFLWWMTGERKYAELAASVFDTYMTGIYYRGVPQDLNHGHQQTLVGMSTFEVIHEDAVNALVPLYDFLYDYLKETKSDKMEVYASAFKKWADNIIAGGVPHNNWNLMQARFVLTIGLVLDDNDRYADGKGREYYIDYVVNRSSIRQWSLKQLAEYGYDAETGIWAECPGYSQVVLNDYTDLVTLFDCNLHRDLTQELPVILQAARANPQYLFPDRLTLGFGDTHPSPINAAIYSRLVANAQRYGKQEQEREFTALLKLFSPAASVAAGKPQVRVAVTSFFADRPLVTDERIPALPIDSCVTPSFYAPNASWLVLRNGMDRRNSLMVALNGSSGNHMHANGISMELYGKGYRLAPDGGIGLTLYSGLDYLEYYSQFPAHNTVCVDGISSYPVMKSNHAFQVQGCFPQPGAKVAYPSVAYSDIYFREPESNADQTRLTSLVTIGDKTGYYVDIFRSRKQEGGDKMHDYFYHNLGQEMQLTASDGSDLSLQPTEELAFAGAHLSAYSYIYDKQMATTSRDLQAVYTMKMPDGDDIRMTMWMKGEMERQVFQTLSPMTEGLSRLKEMPYSVKDQPTLTFVARQKGEAWNRPFVAVYEPSSVKEPGSIASVDYPEVVCTEAGSHVAVRVVHKDGHKDLILSSDSPMHTLKTSDMTARCVYALYGQSAVGDTYFLGNGTFLKTEEAEMAVTAGSGDVLLEPAGDGWNYSASVPFTWTYRGQSRSCPAGKGHIRR